MYKNFDDLEGNLTREELFKLYEKAQEMVTSQRRFMAALKGIDLDKDSKKSSFEEIQRRALAKASGMSEEQLELGDDFEFIDE